MERDHYFPSGMVENFSRKGWAQGYSLLSDRGRPTQPYVTRGTARASSKLAGRKAVFYDSQETAEAAWRADRS
jgi:hypothetical protein